MKFHLLLLLLPCLSTGAPTSSSIRTSGGGGGGASNTIVSGPQTTLLNNNYSPHYEIITNPRSTSANNSIRRLQANVKRLRSQDIFKSVAPSNHANNRSSTEQQRRELQSASSMAYIDSSSSSMPISMSNSPVLLQPPSITAPATTNQAATTQSATTTSSSTTTSMQYTGTTSIFNPTTEKPLTTPGPPPTEFSGPPPDTGTAPPIATLPNTTPFPPDAGRTTTTTPNTTMGRTTVDPALGITTSAGAAEPSTASSTTTEPAAVTGSTPDSTTSALLFATPLALPPGGLRPCNSIIEMNYPNNILPKEVILAVLHGAVDMMTTMAGDDESSTTNADALKAQMEGMINYDVRARKVCTTCEEANALWETSHANGDGAADASFASEIVMPYCREGSFAYGRTIGGLVLEPVDSVTGEVVVGKVAATFWTDVTESNPFLAASQVWPSDLSISQPAKYSVGAMASASAGTFSFVPDVLGNGEDWENVRSYIVKEVYQASAIPLLLKVQDDVQQNYNCTVLDKRIAIMGYSEGGYAAVATAAAIDGLNDGYIHTYTGVGGAPIKLSTEQTKAFVELSENRYAFPPFIGRLANAYSSTNKDLANTDVAGQNMASDEYLDPDDKAKNVVAWSEYGLNYTEIFALMPQPPDANFEDILNPELMDVVLRSWAANNSDPCNSEFYNDSIQKMCESMKDNDLLETVESFEYPVVFCHSPNDEIVYHSNLPDVSSFDNFILMQDLPGGLNPQGDHYETFAECLVGFLFPFMAPPEDGNIRQIMPVEDGTCATTDVGPLAPEPTPAPESSSEQPTEATTSDMPTFLPTSTATVSGGSVLISSLTVALFVFIANGLW